MKPEQPREPRHVDFERAERDPLGVERDVLSATEEGTGQQTLDRAQVVARGLPPPDHPDEPVVNGYQGGDRHLEPPIEEIKRAKLPHAPRQEY